MKFFSRTHHWFIALAILLVVLSLLHGKSELQETRPATGAVFNDYTFILRAIALLLLLNWILYAVSGKLLFSTLLVKLHLILSVFFTTAIFVSLLWKMYSLAGKYAASNEVNFTAIFIVFLLLTQLFYIINLFLGILRRSNE